MQSCQTGHYKRKWELNSCHLATLRYVLLNQVEKMLKKWVARMKNTVPIIMPLEGQKMKAHHNHPRYDVSNVILVS